MREIIFRGKRVDNGEWVEGFYYHLWNPIHGNRIPIIDESKRFDHDGDSISVYEVHPETVGQFTGLTDKNGVKIWERDIVKFITNGDPLPVEISPKYGARPYLKGYGGFEGWYPLISEVIGNIHDNPELLKGGKQ